MSIDYFGEHPPLSLSFYEKHTLELAQALLGCLLFKETKEGVSAGIIVETEAYKGPEDRAAHSFNNRRTKRTEIMFGRPGVTYTYSMHTHCLFNVVSGPVDKPEAVLIRAIEPYYNHELMKKRRPNMKTIHQMTNGPGKLTKALGITMEDYGHSLQDPPLWISERPRGFTSFSVKEGPRIGIDNSGEAKNFPWRYWIDGSLFTSR
ncbi:DNA-3-methyladenine glycosylase [Radiobacillus kanasensis]|uniref:DNA-3-methyladenine glycosylase n=1 Tax=Radiobacillus kanasensis TaxID=2844358 RepID=UPI001E3033FB|nr:DNA-3-methyladenine glycosylase [Radiobacillus kanasensis]UFU01306.1 DNA-3-methyladenine glycosylase [Radiobacillus kanasensis]